MLRIIEQLAALVAGKAARLGIWASGRVQIQDRLRRYASPQDTVTSRLKEYTS